MTCGFKSHLPHQKKERRNVSFGVLFCFKYTLWYTLSKKKHTKNSPQPAGFPGRLGALLYRYYLPASTVRRRLAKSLI